MGEADEMELVYSLIGYPSETEWLEFKEGNSDPERIGKDISALANAAAYRGRDYAYKLWGVDDETRRLEGTSFDPLTKKAKGNQDLQIWLRSYLSANANYDFKKIEHEGRSFVVLQIWAATGQPVYFDGTAYIRVGSSTTKLVAGSAKEAELWRRLQAGSFEERVAEKDVRLSEVSELLDVESYFELIRAKKPSSLENAITALCEQGLVAVQDNGRYAVTNLGALLVARKLSLFSGLGKRTLRVVRFEGKGSFGILDDTYFDKGYALALPEAERYIMATMPAKEVVDGAFRRIETAYPQRAVRELLSNMVIHQDLSDGTAGPMVGIYENRIEFCNPGTTLIPTERVLNAQPKTRNALLAKCMRQMDLCEEGGTGWDLAVASCEALHIPAPRMTSEESVGTRVTLFGDRAYDRMTKAERKDAVYWHACLAYAQDESMGNQSLRERFGLDDSKASSVAMSRLIRECCNDGLIKEEDADAGTKYRRYIPFWA